MALLLPNGPLTVPGQSSMCWVNNNNNNNNIIIKFK